MLLRKRQRAARLKPKRLWRIRDRLSDGDIASLVTAFKAGTPKHQLAWRYGISMKSLKKTLREHDVKKRSRYEEPE